MKPVVLVVRKFDDNLQEENFMTVSFSLRVKQHPDLDKPQKNEQTTWKTRKKKLVNFLSE